MIPMYRYTSVAFAAAMIALAASASGRDLCNRDDLTTQMNACIKINQPSDYQKGGLDDLFKGRFCAKGALARDGMFRCRGDDPEAIKTILGCGVDAMLEVANKLIVDSDVRKPANCN
ncbi:MAG: hypothetical protein ABIP64_14595 [Burkholderiales bacterium]